MKKLRLFVLILVFILVFSACSNEEATEALHVETTVPTEPAPDPIETYNAAISEISNASQVSMQADIEKLVYVDTQVFEEKSSFEITYFEQDAFELLQDILVDAKELDTRVPYEQLVVKNYAENAAQ